MQQVLSDEQLLEVLHLHKDSALEWRKRRHDDWNMTYMLYRSKVIINRLTQRQSVNIPLMKYSIQTLLKDIDEPPLLYFDNLDNDEQKEIYYNEVWKFSSRENKLVMKDIIDKKQALLFGRSFKKLNIVNGRFYYEVVDPQDVLVDRYTDPADINTARYFCHEHIYRPLSSLEDNNFYNQKSVNRLKEKYATEQGLIKAEENSEEMIDRSARMTGMGVLDVDNPSLGETYVELNEHMLYLYDSKANDYVLHLVVTADDSEIMQRTPLYEVIGDTSDNYWYNHINWTWWGGDPERTDIWSDGVGDILRNSNEILNSYTSQKVENRTLRNYNMHYYDSTSDADGDPFVPQTFEPVPWGWYPIPGNPNEKIKTVEVPDLSESLDEMQWLIGIAEKATAATATQQGNVEQRNVTLGEVQLALSNAKERVKSLAVFYNDSWEEFGTKYCKMLEAAQDLLDDVTVYKRGRLTKRMYTRSISPGDWQSSNGYRVEVKQIADKTQEDTDMIQKLQAVRANMPDNIPLGELFKRKLLEFAGVTLEEMNDVLEFERQKMEQPIVLQQDMVPGMSNQPMMNAAPPQPSLPAQTLRA